jgi:hypothetical protein
LEQSLAEVAARVRGFKPPTGDALTAQLKRVADYVTPGKYVLSKAASVVRDAERLKARAAAEPPEPGTADSTRTASPSSDSGSPEPTGPAQKPKESQQSKKQQTARQKGAAGKAAAAAATNHRATPELPQRKGNQPGFHKDRQPEPVAEAQPMLQLMEDDLDIPLPVRLQAVQRPPAAGASSKAALKVRTLVAATATMEPQQQQQQRQNKAALSGQPQQAKKSKVKEVADRQAAAAGSGLQQATKPKKRKSPLGDVSRQVTAATPPPPPPTKPQKRSRLVRLTTTANLCRTVLVTGPVADHTCAC